jgi:uncharacterized membrane protein
MSNKTSIIVSISLVALALIAGILLFNRLPDPMPSHWNAAGQVDGYMSKFWGVFMMPLMTIGIMGLFLLIPQIDPLKANIAQFRGVFNWFIVAFTAYMLFIYALTIAAALGYQFNMTSLILPTVGLLLVGLGFMMKKAKRNFFIGIRTPWTLSNDVVWEKTHRLGGNLFVIAGLVTMLTAFLGERGIWVMLAILMVASLVPVVYSYFVFAQIGKIK